MKVEAWKAADGSLHATEREQVMHDHKTKLDDQIGVLAKCGVHGLKRYEDWDAMAITEETLPDFFRYMIVNYSDAIRKTIDTMDVIRRMNMEDR